VSEMLQAGDLVDLRYVKSRDKVWTRVRIAAVGSRIITFDYALDDGSVTGTQGAYRFYFGREPGQYYYTEGVASSLLEVVLIHRSAMYLLGHVSVEHDVTDETVAWMRELLK